MDYTIYLEYHCVCPLVRIGSDHPLYYTKSITVSVPSSELGPPTPSPASECVTPPPRNQGWGITRLRVRGWADPVRTTGKKAWPSVYSAERAQEA
jgi:hypothetical protein